MTHPGLLPRAVVDQALASLRELVQELGRRGQRVLVHGDCHLLNVLHTMPAQTPPAQAGAGWP